MNADIEKWDERYRDAAERPPARVLTENAHLLPAQGYALDVACGLGSNALLLAERGLEAFAWDSSPVAVEKLKARALARGLAVHAEVRDVVQRPPEADRFDVIVVSRFLDRELAPSLIDALHHQGLLFYQTFTRTRLSESGPTNPDYLLADGELLLLFAPLQPLVYREEGRVGDHGRGFRDEALLVAQKR
ncbi:MAG: class I SAM-dependent methyltransferase [Acidiferrobacterales bacterium]